MNRRAALLMTALFAASALALTGCPGGNGGGYGLGPASSLTVTASSSVSPAAAGGYVTHF